jgi:hypothetical protein
LPHAALPHASAATPAAGVAAAAAFLDIAVSRCGKPVARRLKTVKKLACRTLWSLEGVLFPLSRYGGAPIWTGLTVKTRENCPGPIRTLTAATSNLFEVATGSRWKPLAFGGCTFLPFSRSFAFF